MRRTKEIMRGKKSRERKGRGERLTGGREKKRPESERREK